MESLSDVLSREREAEDVELLRDNIRHMGVLALFARGAGMRNLTVIDRSVRDPAEVNVLDAHELGHHRCNPQGVFRDAPRSMMGNLFDMNPALAQMFESMADREATSICVSPERLIEAYAEGCRQPHEFAEALEITEAAYLEGVERQQNRYGTRRFFHMGYTMTFVPLVIRES